MKLLPQVQAMLGSVNAMSLASLCVTNSTPSPALKGVHVLGLESTLVVNLTTHVPEAFYINHGSVDVQNVTYCNMTVTYTHPGYNDNVNVETWLPIGNWNGRLQGIGGGGWQAGRFGYTNPTMQAAVGEGFVVVTTDGGHTADDPEAWAQISPANVDYNLLQDFAATSLNEAANIARSLSTAFYGQAPKYSYFSGCSQGGRQGLMLAQRYPEAYDGIASSAPAINWSEMIISNLWAQATMNDLNIYPRNCELDALTAAAIRHCDSQDGVEDGMISYPKNCDFNASMLVGQSFWCNDTATQMNISSGAALIAIAAWTGMTSSSGDSLWPGLNHGAPLTGGISTIVDTSCPSNGSCIGAPLSLSTDWIRLFVEKDPSFNARNLSRKQVEAFFHQSIREYGSIIGTNDADLSAFRDAGGKMMGFHGLADTIISPGGTQNYYDRVTMQDARIRDYYRMFEAPGLGHCYGGQGVYPSGVFSALMAWVENGTVPEQLVAKKLSGQVMGAGNDEGGWQRLLCPVPKKSVFSGGGDWKDLMSWECQ